MDKQPLCKHYYGFDLLRIIMTFGVVLNHFWDADKSDFLYPILKDIQTCAVPSFMLLSFFLTQGFIVTLDCKRLKKRLVRLAIPYVFWGLTNWIIMFSVDCVFHANTIDGFRVLFFQLLLGHGFHVNAPLWYLNSLMVITVLFALFFKTFGKVGGFVAIYTLSILALVIQYTQVLYKLTSDWSFETKYPVGRFPEMMPYAALGLTLGLLQMKCFLNKKIVHKVILFVSVVVVVVYTLFQDRLHIPYGFGYQGVVLLVASTATFILFLFINPQRLCESRLFQTVARHTLGIYCIHYLVGRLFKTVLQKSNVSINSVVLCILVYLTSYIIADVISRIRIKRIQMLVD